MPNPGSIGIRRTPALGFDDRNATPGNISYHGGRLLTNVEVFPVFWGSQWLPAQHPPIQIAEVIWAIRTILFGPFMSGLAEYNSIQKGSVKPAILAVFDGDPPEVFSILDLANMLQGRLPDPTTDDQALACVFTPPGVRSTDASAIGFHQPLSFISSGQFNIAWIGNDGTLDVISTTFSHELAEACTDPTLQGFFDDAHACGQDGVCEIADFCNGAGPAGGSAIQGGVWVQGYWSNVHNSCIVPPERFVEGLTQGGPSLIQGRFLSPGNFELVAPLQSGGIAHYSRVNSDAALPWAGPAVFATELGRVDAVSLIQSTFTAGANVGNLEVVALSQGSLFAYWREDVPPYIWHGPTLIPSGGRTFRGNPSLIQGRFLTPGNFELVAPLAAGGMAHFSRVNVEPGTPWFGPNIFGVELGLVDAVALIQGPFSSGGHVGNLEVAVRCGGTLFSYSRDDLPPYTWHGPAAISVPGSQPDLQLAAGIPGLVHNHADFPGNFELVTPLASGGLAHYSRINNQPGTPWSGPSIFGVSLGQIDSVSLIQSNFKLQPSGVGNLELISQVQGHLVHFWFDNPIDPATEIFPWNWFGPWVVTE